MASPPTTRKPFLTAAAVAIFVAQLLCLGPASTVSAEPLYQRSTFYREASENIMGITQLPIKGR